MGLTEKSMLERWEMAKIEERLDKAQSIKQQKVCCTSNITDDEAQARDVEPVKRGRREAGVTCSKCGFIRQITRSGNLMVGKYCPNCGAKMEEDEE